MTSVESIEKFEDILADFRIEVDRAHARACDRLRESVNLSVAAPSCLNDHQRRNMRMLTVGDAARLSRLSKSRVRELCAENIYNSDDGGITATGFGYKSGGRWMVLEENFIAYIRPVGVSGV
jgi:hypothetical protein